MFGGLSAEPDDGPIREHDLDPGHVIRGDAVGEGVRAAGVLGDVPAERAGLLARGIRHEIEAMRRDRG